MLDAGVTQRLLSPLAASRVRHLCQHGLSIEQALIGTGLLSLQQYGELASELVGHPLAGDLEVGEEPPQFAEWVPEELRRRHLVHPLFEEGQELAVGFVRLDDPKDLQALRKHLRLHGRTVRPFVILFSDWRRLYADEVPSYRLGAWLRQVLRVADTQQASEITLQGREDRVHILLDEIPASLDEMPQLFLPSASFSSLVLLIERLLAHKEWQLTHQDQRQERLSLVRNPSDAHDHPIHLVQHASREASEGEPGLRLLIDPDAYTRAWLKQELSLNLEDEVWYAEPHESDELEALAHAVMAGSSGTIVLTHRLFDEAKPVWHALQEAGVPIQVVRAHRVAPGQLAWESAPYSL